VQRLGSQWVPKFPLSNGMFVYLGSTSSNRDALEIMDSTLALEEFRRDVVLEIS